MFDTNANAQKCNRKFLESKMYNMKIIHVTQRHYNTMQSMQCQFIAHWGCTEAVMLGTTARNFHPSAPGFD